MANFCIYFDSERLVADALEKKPKWVKWAPRKTKSGLIKDQKWTKNEPKIDEKHTKDGSKIDHIETKMDQKSEALQIADNPNKFV